MLRIVGSGIVVGGVEKLILVMKIVVLMFLCRIVINGRMNMEYCFRMFLSYLWCVWDELEFLSV